MTTKLTKDTKAAVIFNRAERLDPSGFGAGFAGREPKALVSLVSLVVNRLPPCRHTNLGGDSLEPSQSRDRRNASRSAYGWP